MLPGFITIFKDDDGRVHLYFYKGYTDSGKLYYNDLNLANCKYEYEQILHDDGAYEYVFDNKNIKSMRCKLVSYDRDEKSISLKI